MILWTIVGKHHTDVGYTLQPFEQLFMLFDYPERIPHILPVIGMLNISGRLRNDGPSSKHQVGEYLLLIINPLKRKTWPIVINAHIGPYMKSNRSGDTHSLCPFQH